MSLDVCLSMVYSNCWQFLITLICSRGAQSKLGQKNTLFFMIILKNVNFLSTVYFYWHYSYPQKVMAQNICLKTCKSPLHVNSKKIIWLWHHWKSLYNLLLYSIQNIMTHEKELTVTEHCQPVGVYNVSKVWLNNWIVRNVPNLCPNNIPSSMKFFHISRNCGPTFSQKRIAWPGVA